jgi:23S rRNA (uracil1939-C5)-methyltransferase
MRRPFGNPFGQRAPVEAGKVYRIKIEDLGSTGDGIGKVQGFIVFVKDSIPGEDVDVRIVRVGEKSAMGVIVKNHNAPTGGPTAPKKL